MLYGIILVNLSGGENVSDYKLENSAENDDRSNPESEVSKLIKQIRKSADYDEVSIELYSKMCVCYTDPPYDKWVATWILKCIDEVFGRSIEADIVRASFALLPGYVLLETTIQQRLERYLDESSYLLRYPSPSKRTLDEIKADPNGQAELKKIKRKLTRKDSDCLNELIKYIENIDLPEIVKHLSDLENYGDLASVPGDKKGYEPKLEGLYYPKKGSYDEVDVEPIEEKLTDTKTESDKISVNIVFSNGGNVDIREASASKAVLDTILAIAKLAAMTILVIICSIRLYMNVVDYQATEKLKDRGYTSEAHDNDGGYQPNKSVENYQSNKNWGSKAVPYDREINQDSVSEYVRSQIGSVNYIIQPFWHDPDLPLEDMDDRNEVDIASLGEDE